MRVTMTAGEAELWRDLVSSLELLAVDLDAELHALGVPAFRAWRIAHHLDEKWNAETRGQAA